MIPNQKLNWKTHLMKLKRSCNKALSTQFQRKHLCRTGPINWERSLFNEPPLQLRRNKLTVVLYASKVAIVSNHSDHDRTFSNRFCSIFVHLKSLFTDVCLKYNLKYHSTSFFLCIFIIGTTHPRSEIQLQQFIQTLPISSESALSISVSYKIYRNYQQLSQNFVPIHQWF